MNRIAIANLTNVTSLDGSEMAGVVGGGFVGTFPNTYPSQKPVTRVCRIRLRPRFHIYCYNVPYHPPLR